MYQLKSFRARIVGDGEPNLDSVAEFISKNIANEKVVGFLNKVRPINEDLVKGWVESDENGKKFATSLADKRVNDAIRTHDEKFTKEKLPKIESEIKEKLVKELNPKETPEQKELRELRDRTDRLEKENQQNKLRNTALELITENGLPFAKLVDKFIGEDAETTVKNIQSFKDVWDSALQEAVTKAMGKNNGRNPESREPGKAEPLETQLENARKRGDLLEQIKIKNLIADEKAKAK